MSLLNSDVERRLQVAVDLGNAQHDGTLSAAVGPHPHRVFTSNGYRSTDDAGEWSRLEAVAARIRHAVDAITEGDEASIGALVNDWLQDSGATVRLARDERQWRLHFHRPDLPFAAGWDAGIAAAVALSLSSEPRGRLGSCTASGCARLFVDRGSNRQRQFCSLRCQNRSKSAAYRARAADRSRES